MIPGILLVLKIIGIIVLSIVILVLLIATLLLFVPIRYKIKAKKEEVLVAEARATWLFSLLSICFQYEEGQRLLVRLFGVPLYDSRTADEKQKKKQEKQERKEKKRAKKEEIKEIKKEKKRQILELEASQQLNSDNTTELNNDSTSELNNQTASDLKIQERKEQYEKSEEQVTEEQITEGNVIQENEQINDSDSKIVLFFKKIIALFKKIVKNIRNGAYTFQKMYARIVQMGNTISYYYEVWNRKETQEAYQLCKHSLHRIWKQVKPRKLKIFLKVGTDDPSVTGQILVFYSMCYPYIGKSVKIEPDFEQFILEGTVWIRGRITIFVLLCVAWKLFFDRNIRNVLAMFKKEEL